MAARPLHSLIARPSGDHGPRLARSSDRAPGGACGTRREPSAVCTSVRGPRRRRRVPLARHPFRRPLPAGASAAPHLAGRSVRNRSAEAGPGPQYPPVRSRAFREQRAALRFSGHRQIVARQGVAERVRSAGPASDRGRQAGPHLVAGPRGAAGIAARAVHPLLRRSLVRSQRAGIQGVEGDSRTDRSAPRRTTCFSTRRRTAGTSCRSTCATTSRPATSGRRSTSPKRSRRRSR